MKPRWINSGDNWATPPSFKQWLIDNGHLAADHFDPCPLNNDIEKMDGLKIDWEKDNFINPPYSKAPIKKQWVLKTIEEAKKGCNCTLLLPVSTSTKLWHQTLNPLLLNMQYGKDWFFVEKRIPFIGVNSKGQYVNIPKEERPTWSDTDVVQHKGSWLPKYINASGMHDSIIIKFFDYPGTYLPF